jgi:hypothetical protein
MFAAQGPVSDRNVPGFSTLHDPRHGDFVGAPACYPTDYLHRRDRLAAHMCMLGMYHGDPVYGVRASDPVQMGLGVLA